jgi:hypothetical protein
MMRRPWRSARGSIAWIALLVAAGLSADGLGAPFAAMLERLGFNRGDIAALDRGEATARNLDAQSYEVAVAGAVRVEAPREYFVSRFRDIANWKRSDLVPEVGRFGEPPTVADLALLTLPQGDVEALRSCRPGHCDVKLPTEMLVALERARKASGAPADDENVRMFKEMLVARVQAFRQGGAARLAPYVGTDAYPLSARLADLLAAGAGVLGSVPEFQRHLATYPSPPPGDGETFAYWSKEKTGPRQIVSLTHVSLYTKELDGATVTIGASLDLYSTHYLDGSIGLTLAVEPAADRGKAFYLLYVNRTHVDVLKGFFGGFNRWIVRRRVRGALEDTVGRAKQRLEHDYRELRNQETTRNGGL